MQQMNSMSELKGVSIGTSDSSMPTQTEIYECPWKYKGYRDFTSYMAADPDFFAVRRFGRLHTRALLTLQDQIVELEKRLDAMDQRFSLKTTKLSGFHNPVVVDTTVFEKRTNSTICASKELEPPETRDINNGTIRDDIPERAELVSQVIERLKEYDRLLLDHCSLMNMSVAPIRNVKNIESWILCNKGAIMEEETDFVNHRDDLVSGRTRKPILRVFFEDQIILRTKTLLGLFKKSPSSSMSLYDRQEVYQFSDQAIDELGSLMILVIALLMLIAPLWILQALEDKYAKLAVITAFIVICLFFLTLATMGRPFETIAATAGYGISP